jgi:hypothetical protein
VALYHLQKADGVNNHPAPKEDDLMKKYFESLSKRTDEVGLTLI